MGSWRAPLLSGWTILAQGYRRKRFTAGHGPLTSVSVFQQCMTEDGLREFSDKENSCSLRVRIPVSW